MKTVYIEQFGEQQYGKVNFYTLRFDEDDKSTTEYFIAAYRHSHTDDLKKLRAWLKNIQERGAREYYFRFENNACAGPKEVCGLRIYCIRCGDKVVILNGGGAKTSRTAQEGVFTKKYFDFINRVEKKFREKIQAGEITYEGFYGERLAGELFVEI